MRSAVLSLPVPALQRLLLAPSKAILPSARPSQHCGADWARGHIDLRPLSPHGTGHGRASGAGDTERDKAAEPGGVPGSLRDSTVRRGLRRDPGTGTPRAQSASLSAHHGDLPLAAIPVRHSKSRLSINLRLQDWPSLTGS